MRIKLAIQLFLLGVLLVTCTTTSQPVFQNPLVIFRFQIAKRIDSSQIRVQIRDASGTCVSGVVPVTAMGVMLDNPEDVSVREFFTAFDSCSQTWTLPSQPRDRSEDFKVSGPRLTSDGMSVFTGDVHVRDLRDNRSGNPAFFGLDLQSQIPETGPRSTQQSGTAALLLSGSPNTPLTTAAAPIPYFRYTQQTLDFNSNPRRGVAQFKFFAGNPSDRNDNRVVIVYGGSFSLVPDRQ
jgi:hypothetical protein